MKTVSPQKPLTIREFAEAIGVSRTTVSKAFTGSGRMSETTRNTVLEAAKQLGYEPNLYAQSLSNGHANNTVGLLSLSFDLGVGTRKILMLQQLLSARGFDVPLHIRGFSHGEEIQNQVALVNTLRRQRPRAILCNTKEFQSEALAELQRYQEEGGLVVSYEETTALECDQVIFDRAANTYQAARHLLDLGHREIGFYVVGIEKPGGERLEGFARALQEEGISVRDEWLFYGALAFEYEKGGALMAEQFLRLKHRPTALCMINDASAAAFIAAAGRLGIRVPHDVSIVGHDDLPVASYNTVPLTTVSHPLEEIAGEAVELLCSRLDGRYFGPARHKVVQGNLVVRESATSR